MIEELRAQTIADLGGWREPNGYLVPTDPEPDDRALTRIRLRSFIAALDQVLGLEHDWPGNERADRLDLDIIVRERSKTDG